MLEEKHRDEYEALTAIQDKQDKALRENLVQRLKALADGRPQRLSASTEGPESYSEQLRILAKTEDEEMDALAKEHRKELDAMHEAQHQDEKVIKEIYAVKLKEAQKLETLRQAQELKALTEAPPASLNKRSSDNAGGRKTKRTRI